MSCHVRPIVTLRRLRFGGLLAALAMLFSGPSARGADLVIEMRMMQQVSPGSFGNAMEIDLVNTSSTNSYTLAGFNVGIDVAFPIILNSVTDIAASNYVFAGNTSGLTLSGQSPSYAISDQVMNSQSPTTLAPDTTFGLGLVLFSVASDASAGPEAVTIDPSTTLVSEGGHGGGGGGHAGGSGSSLDYTSQAGTILISSVPEPSSVVAGGTALVILTAAFWVRRHRAAGRDRADR